MASDRPLSLVILDLDNTCICAMEMDELHEVTHPEKFRHVDLEDIYRIYERPGLQHWLDELFKHYRVAVWTAAGLTYALFVIKNFIVNNDSSRTIEFVKWDDHCDPTYRRSKGQTKKVTLLEPLYDHKFTVLIDDNKDVLRQTLDTINSDYFDVTDPLAHKDQFCKMGIQPIMSYFDAKHKTKTRLRDQVKMLLHQA